MSDLSALAGVKRKSVFGAVRAAFDPKRSLPGRCSGRPLGILKAALTRHPASLSFLAEGCSRCRWDHRAPVNWGISAMTANAASHVYFGLDPMWASTCVLAITYATIMSEKVNRSIVALVGAGVMILVGVLDQDEAIKGVDWNTIRLLTGMMILGSSSRRSRIFQ